MIEQEFNIDKKKVKNVREPKEGVKNKVDDKVDASSAQRQVVMI